MKIISIILICFSIGTLNIGLSYTGRQLKALQDRLTNVNKTIEVLNGQLKKIFDK